MFRPFVLLLVAISAVFLRAQEHTAANPRDFDSRTPREPIRVQNPGARFTEGLRLTGVDTQDGLTISHYRQEAGGIPVYQATARLAVNRAGDVVFAERRDVVRNLVPAGPARLRPEEAARAAFERIGVRPAPELSLESAAGQRLSFRNPGGRDPIVPELVYFPTGDDTARLAYRMFLDIDERRWYEVIVDAEDGSLLKRANLVRSVARARVYKVSPLKADRELLDLPDAWIGANIQTSGNNADALYAVAGGSDTRPTAQSQLFDFPIGVEAAATSLFYFTNVAHDYFYGLGFTESAGNFQQQNFGRGGTGGDAVRAIARSAGTDGNAFFSTPPDGLAPRMNVGTIGTGTDQRDLAYGGDVILHEYGHGVSDRLIGGSTASGCLSGIQSGALSEGWSDYFGISHFNDPVLGAYSTKNPTTGIRRQSYEGYTLTLEHLGNERFEVHNDGEIWAATLWDLRKALGAETLDRLVVAAMKLTPCRPSMPDARDALLKADQAMNNAANRARMWPVFARHGLGASASGVEGAGETTLYNVAFDQPADLQTGNRNPVVTSRPPVPIFGANYSYQIAASDPDGGRLTYALAGGPRNFTVDGTGLVSGAVDFLSELVKVTVTDGQGGKVIHCFNLAPDAVIKPDVVAKVSSSVPKTTGRMKVAIPAGTPVLQVTLRGGSGDADLVVEDPDGVVQGVSARDGNLDTLSIAAPKAGVWIVGVITYIPFSGVSVLAALPVPKLISPNGVLSGLSGELGSETFYRAVVPQGATQLGVAQSEGTGDADIYVRRAKVPVCQFSRFVSSRCAFDQASEEFGNLENIVVSVPEAGDWFITMTAYRAYASVRLAVSLATPAVLTVGTNSLSFAATAGGSESAAQQVTFLNARGQTFAWTAAAATTSGGTWLRLDKTSGSGDATLSVFANPGALAAGVYRGSVTINATGLTGSPQTIDVTFTVAARPVLAVASTALAFVALRGQDPAAQTVAINNSGASTLSWTATAATDPAATWLAVDPASGTGNGSLRISARVTGLTDGVYSGTVTITAAGAANSPVSIRITLTVGAPVSLTAQGVLNAGSFKRSQSVAEGEILSLFGADLTDACTGACPSPTGFPLPTQLGSTRVRVNGVPAPLLLALPTQINVQVPFGLAGTTATIVVERGPVSSAPIMMPLARQSIGILTALGIGSGAGVILHADGRLVSAAAPILADEVLVIYLLGLGPVSPAVIAGEAAPSLPPLAETTIPMKVLFDQEQGTIFFSGLAPGFAGLYQMNVKAPSTLPRKFPVVSVTSEFAASNEVSAGGPSILDVTPAIVPAGADATVVIRGLNFSATSTVHIGGQTLTPQFTDGPLPSLAVTIPGGLLRTGEVQIVVRESTDGESNPGRLTVQ